MPQLPAILEADEPLGATWGNQIVNYLGALNDKIDGVEQRLVAMIERGDQRVEAKIDEVNDNIERLFQRVYPDVDFE